MTKQNRVVGEDELFEGCDECREGWVCEQHPDKPWPHPDPTEPDGDCAGPGMPCECNPDAVMNWSEVYVEVEDNE